MLKLTEMHSNWLLTVPESGMGYQCVEGILQGKTQKYIVFNAELLVASEELEEIKKSASYDDLLKEIRDTLEEISYLKSISVLDFLESTFSYRSHNPAELSIEYTRDEYTRDGERFIRFSAYKNDRRITPNRGLFEGTYATTVNDGHVVPSGLSAVARYALPNPWPAIYVLAITPPKDTKIRCGTVRPAFNQSGGGVEILFQNRTPDNTVSGPKVIPER